MKTHFTCTRKCTLYRRVGCAIDIHMRQHTDVQTHKHTDTYTHTHAHTCAHTHTHMHTHTHTHTCTHIHAHARTHTRTCTHTYTHMNFDERAGMYMLVCARPPCGKSPMNDKRGCKAIVDFHFSAPGAELRRCDMHGIPSACRRGVRTEVHTGSMTGCLVVVRFGIWRFRLMLSARHVCVCVCVCVCDVAFVGAKWSGTKSPLRNLNQTSITTTLSYSHCHLDYAKHKHKTRISSNVVIIVQSIMHI